MRKLLVFMTVAVLLATGCSKKEAGPAPAGSRTPSASPSAGESAAPVTLTGTANNHGAKDATDQGASVSLEIEQDDNYFEPTFIRATPGAAVMIELKNEGDQAHTFTIDALKVDKTLQSGSTADVTFNLPSSGVVRFYCRIHVGSGMQGAFYFS